MSRAVQAASAVLAVAIAQAGCSLGRAQARVLGPDAPGWVQDRSGAFLLDGRRVLRGVGIASGVEDAEIRREQSEGRAREELADLLDQYRKLSREGAATGAGAGAGVPAGPAASGAGPGAGAALALPAGVRIVSHWVDGQDPDRSEYALAELDVGMDASRPVDPPPAERGQARRTSLPGEDVAFARLARDTALRVTAAREARGR